MGEQWNEKGRHHKTQDIWFTVNTLDIILLEKKEEGEGEQEQEAKKRKRKNTWINLEIWINDLYYIIGLNGRHWWVKSILLPNISAQTTTGLKDKPQIWHNDLH